jgi:HSP20 family protein
VGEAGNELELSHAGRLAGQSLDKPANCPHLGYTVCHRRYGAVIANGTAARHPTGRLGAGHIMSIDRQFGWMWAQACELLDRADRMQRQFVRYVGPGADAAVWEPPVDIQETAEGLHFVFALPGVQPEQIAVELDSAALTVNAVRAPRLGAADSIVRRLEIPHGRFVRRIALAGAQLQIAETRYVNGCLEVRLVRAGDHPERE